MLGDVADETTSETQGKSLVGHPLLWMGLNVHATTFSKKGCRSCNVHVKSALDWRNDREAQSWPPLVDFRFHAFDSVIILGVGNS